MKRKRIITIFVAVLMPIMLGCSPKATKPENSIQDGSALETAQPRPGDYFIVRSEDDAEEGTSGQVDLTNEDLDLGQLSGFESAKAIGIRFEGIRVAKGQKITRAFLQFTMEGNRTKAKPTELTIRAELSPNASSFKEEARNISSRKLTEASVKWVPEAWNPEQVSDRRARTPDLSSLILELVNQDDWEEGNALALIITGTGERDAISFDGGGKSEGPMLRIETS